MTSLLRFPAAQKRDPAIELWWRLQPPGLGSIAERWFTVMRQSGAAVRELLHDGHPTACVGDAAFGYVDSYRAHVNVGFFRGADLPDPARLLEGQGKAMRHVKVRPGTPLDEAALGRLIAAAYADMLARVESERAP
jgi:hypothetical protein